MTPVRLQRQRTAGFRLQTLSIAINGLNARSVTRPGRWGNSFRVGCRCHFYPTKQFVIPSTILECVELHRRELAWFLINEPAMQQRLEELRGLNLACSCGTTQPFCHADTLIALANLPPWKPGDAAPLVLWPHSEPLDKVAECLDCPRQHLNVAVETSIRDWHGLFARFSHAPVLDPFGCARGEHIRVQAGHEPAFLYTGLTQSAAIGALVAAAHERRGSA
jgi:hypothetical protein